MRVVARLGSIASVAALALASIGCDGVDPGFDGGAADAGAPPLLDAGVAPDDGGAGPADAAAPDAGPSDVDGGAMPPPEPDDIFFVGNSFTFGGPIPVLVHDLAVAAGHVEPNVEYRALPGVTLQTHRADTDADGAPARVAEGWDVVVLQENSLRPTDALGDPEQFKEDATWFHDLAREARPESRVILYETWARRAGHSVYDRAFADPADMQEQLRFHYFDAAGRYIPTFSVAAVPPSAEVAPVGDAWEWQLARGEPPRLHADDDWHAGPAGQYLNALVIYGTIYGRRTRGLVALGVDALVAEELQEAADATTGAVLPPPVLAEPIPIADGAVLRADVGPTVADGWPALTASGSSAGPLETVAGDPTGARIAVSGFSGGQTGGRADNALGWPAEVSADTLWIGTFDGHAAALGRVATATVTGLPPGRYAVELFASRTGDDGGNGRLTRYTVGGASVDLEVADNASERARFDDVRPDDLGAIRVDVEVSPDGSARFAYLGAIVITRVGG